MSEPLSPAGSAEQAVRSMADAAIAGDMDRFLFCITRKNRDLVRQLLTLFEAMTQQMDAAFGPGSVKETRGPIGGLLRLEILSCEINGERTSANVLTRATRKDGDKEQVQEQPMTVILEEDGWYVEPPEVANIPPEVREQLAAQGAEGLGKQIGEGMAQMFQGLADSAGKMAEGVAQGMGAAAGGQSDAHTLDDVRMTPAGTGSRAGSSEEWPFEPAERATTPAPFSRGEPEPDTMEDLRMTPGKPVGKASASGKPTKKPTVAKPAKKAAKPAKKPGKPTKTKKAAKAAKTSQSNRAKFKPKKGGAIVAKKAAKKSGAKKGKAKGGKKK